MIEITEYKTAYIVHPLTTGGRSTQQNVSIVNSIREWYIKNGKFVPVAPHVVLSGICSLQGDQSEAYSMAIAVMIQCHEVHVYDKLNWFQSKGCSLEVAIARARGMPVKVCDYPWQEIKCGKCKKKISVFRQCTRCGETLCEDCAFQWGTDHYCKEHINKGLSNAPYRLD